MPAIEDRDFEEIRAFCPLPQMDIDIVHRRSRGTGELLMISVEMLPFPQRLDRPCAP